MQVLLPALADAAIGTLVDAANVRVQNHPIVPYPAIKVLLDHTRNDWQPWHLVERRYWPALERILKVSARLGVGRQTALCGAVGEMAEDGRRPPA
jgi:hypothetical protein